MRKEAKAESRIETQRNRYDLNEMRRKGIDEHRIDRTSNGEALICKGNEQHRSETKWKSVSM